MLTRFFIPMIRHAANILLQRVAMSTLEGKAFIRLGCKGEIGRIYAVSSDAPGLLIHLRGGPLLADEVELNIGEANLFTSTKDVVSLLKRLQDPVTELAIHGTKECQRFKIVMSNAPKLTMMISRSYILRTGGIYFQLSVGSFSGFPSEDLAVLNREDDRDDWTFEEYSAIWQARKLEEDPAFCQDVIMPGNGFPGLCLVRTPIRFWTPWRAHSDLVDFPGWALFETARQYDTIQHWHRMQDIVFDRADEPFKYEPLSMSRVSRWDDRIEDEGKALIVTPSWEGGMVMGLLIVSKAERRIARMFGGQMAFRRYLVQTGSSLENLIEGWKRLGLSIRDVIVAERR